MLTAWYLFNGSRVASNASVWGGLRGPPLFYAIASSAPVSRVGGTPVMHPDAGHGAQFSEGGLVQNTFQQASNRLKGPTISSGLELGNAICVNS